MLCPLEICIVKSLAVAHSVVKRVMAHAAGDSITSQKMPNGDTVTEAASRVAAAVKDAGEYLSREHERQWFCQTPAVFEVSRGKLASLALFAY